MTGALEIAGTGAFREGFPEAFRADVFLEGDLRLGRPDFLFILK